MKDSKIIRNAVKCLTCGDVIESKHRHDFVKCSCGGIAVDGGHDYLRLVGDGPWEDLSVLEDIPALEEEKESQSSKHCDAGYMNDMRFGE